MIKVGLIGAGKMGISHLAILGAHKDVQVNAVAEKSGLVRDVLERYGTFKCYDDHNELLKNCRPDAVIISVPTRFHAPIVRAVMEKGIHVFVEKPFCLNASEGEDLVHLAKIKNIINQVGYHNKFIKTFKEARRIIQDELLGDIKHFNGEQFGPVVTKRKEMTWRSKSEEGGGCLMDYAAHLIDLINYMIGNITSVKSAELKSFYSHQVEDAVYALVQTSNGIGGTLNVNWSDETYRKMSTSITIMGTKGKMIVDGTELKIYFKETPKDRSYYKGWNIRHINEFPNGVEYYLRGEEYSEQLDHFIKAVSGKEKNNINTFESAWKTDQIIEQIRSFKQYA